MDGKSIPTFIALFIGTALAAHAEPVSYEQFGAKGDGAADDLTAIVRVHAHANEHGLPVKSKPGTTDHWSRSMCFGVG